MSFKLFDHQLEAVDKICTGSILCGGVGSGKSLTAIGYYYLKNGGEHSFLTGGDYVKMKKPKDLYIITTAQKRDKLEWDDELRHFLLSTHEDLNTLYSNKIIVDSWNNIKKYSGIKDAFFILDEQRLVGNGTWVKSFYKIAKQNDWILLSATPGDCWADYIPVFVANGFYKHKTDFIDQHVIYARFSKYPKIDRYVNTKRLTRLRDRILIDMDFHRDTVRINEDTWCTYDIPLYKNTNKNRWNPFKDEPIQQAAGLCYVLRRIVNADESRQVALFELMEKHPRIIVFYNFDYELDILKSLYYGEDVEVAEWNGHKHQEIPNSNKWVYLVQYTAGCEGWNCIKTDTIVFYSQNYSYKVLEQASGRIDRLNTPYKNLYYYHLKSKSPIDLAIGRALKMKRKFNERKFAKLD